MYSRARGVFASTLVLAGLAACDVHSRCGAPDSCDIRHLSCQRHALRYAVCLRDRGESAALDIAVETPSRSDFLNARVLDAQATDNHVERTLRRGLALFSMSPAVSDSESEARARYASTNAIYESDPPRITVVDYGGALTGRYVVTLVHEMVHALQDAAGELHDDTTPHRFDAQLARNAIVEGEATILADEALIAGLNLHFDKSLYQRSLHGYDRYSRSYFFANRDVVSGLSGRFSYAQGANYLWPLRRDGGARAIASAFAALPVSTYAVMTHDADRSAERPDDLGDDAVPVFPDLTLAGTMHVGRYGYRAYTDIVLFSDGYFPLPSDAGFVADTFSVFTSEADVVVAVWRWRFDDADIVADTVARIRDADPSLRVDSDGTDMWITMSDDAAQLALLPAEYTFEAAPEADGIFAAGPTSASPLACEEPPVSAW